MQVNCCPPFWGSLVGRLAPCQPLVIGEARLPRMLQTVAALLIIQLKLRLVAAEFLHKSSAACWSFSTRLQFL